MLLHESSSNFPSNSSSILFSQFSGKSLKLRMIVSLWILSSVVTFTATKPSNHLEAQFWLVDTLIAHSVMTSSSPLEDLFPSTDLCTATEQSCDITGVMTGLTVEQKKTIKSLYKSVRKIAHSEAHLNFLSKSLDTDFIPKCFRIKNNLPGNPTQNENRMKTVSVEAMKDEHNLKLQ